MNSLFKDIRFITLFFTLLCVFFTGSSSFAQEELSGAQSGILPAGLYDVVDDITVEAYTDWNLDAGVQLRFLSGTALNVRGTLVAAGTESDSIRFSRYEEDEPWDGISVFGWAYVRFQHAVITGSNKTAIYSYNSGNLHITDSRISNNSDIIDDYAGIHSQSGLTDTLWNTTISDNDGIGYYWWNCFADIQDCVFSGNTESAIRSSQAVGSIKNTLFIGNLESGLINHASNIEIDSCEFIGNTAENGGAIRAHGGMTTVKRTLFTGNSATQNGGVLSTGGNNGTHAQISHCVLANNSAESQGSALYMSQTDVVSCIIVNNTGGSAIHCFDSDSPTFNSIFYNNDSDYTTESPLPYIHFGEIVTVNANGDSCDAYENLFRDPRFDLDLPYYLLADSPAIDAGNAQLEPLDPDNTITDIGVHYFDQLAVVEEWPLTQLPGSAGFLNAWPNPFNSTVRLSYETPVPGVGSYTIYTVTGQLVESGVLNSRRGYNELIWKAPD
ncbi:MAG TPA: hypothetical protein ENH10_02480, partial [Bacteroidetes bacterium]|nr:hypothetical protein [Bacteroidota bacterium]HEX04006.1 hypothetical protein [Bacteroidota bacterium]